MSFRSLGGHRIHGYAITWADRTPRPLVVHAHGYRSQAEPRLEWVRAGCHVLGFDVRGFGRSVDAVPYPSPAGWLLTGVRLPETSVLRGAVCDYVRATEVADALGVSTLRAVRHGVSLAGGLALMAEAVAPRADLLALGVPTFGWSEGRRLLVERGSGAEVATFLERHPQYPEDDLQMVLAYFDAALLAPAVRCPTVLGLGLVDRVVPFASVQAIVERLRAPLEVMEFPISHDSVRPCARGTASTSAGSRSRSPVCPRASGVSAAPPPPAPTPVAGRQVVGDKRRQRVAVGRIGDDVRQPEWLCDDGAEHGPAEPLLEVRQRHRDDQRLRVEPGRQRERAGAQPLR